MKWPKRAKLFSRIDAGLGTFSATKRTLPGVADDAERSTLAMQMVASLRRLDYTAVIRERPIDPRRCDPNDSMFDPERAAILAGQAGDLDEAIWLVFLATHFGKHPRYGWRRVRDVYSGLGGILWTWDRVSRDVPAFRNWLQANKTRIAGGFGNHRKYEASKGIRRRGQVQSLQLT